MPIENQAYASIQKCASWFGMSAELFERCAAEFWKFDVDHMALLQTAMDNGINSNVANAIVTSKYY